MTLPSSGALSLNNIAGEFGGSTPHSLSEYYAVTALVPSSGAISISDFYGQAVPDPGSSLLHTLNNPNPGASDEFGGGVATDGNYTIVGTRSSAENRVYIYNNATGALTRTLTNPNAFGTTTGDGFATQIAVGISGNYAIVGARFEDDSSNSNSGRAYVFNVSTGALVRTISSPNAVSNGNLGWDVDISGNYAIITAKGESNGRAYIYNVTNGSLVATINNPGANSGDNFGFSCAISGDRAIVGAYTDDNVGSNAGAAYIFNVSNGALVHTINNPNAFGTADGDDFGFSVGISGNRAIVGAYEEDASGVTQSGAAYIFNVSNGALVYTLTNPNDFGTGQSDRFGFSVGISGNRAIVGANLEDTSSLSASGIAYVYNLSNGSLLYTIDNPNPFTGTGGDLFGAAVDISDYHAVVGAYAEDDSGGSNSGKAYIY